jgi:predicted dehydrogenase
MKVGVVRLLWHGEWIDAPGYDVPESGVLVAVVAVVPLVTIENASGRVTRQPRRKMATFLLTDGPRRTLRKARTKLDEPKFTGDFRISVILGDVIPSRRRVIALATRVPACSQQLVIHQNLVLQIADSFSPADLQSVADRLLKEADALTRLGRQNFLYSAMEPPEELARMFRAALVPSTTRSSASSARATEVLVPPDSNTQAADTVLMLQSRPGQAGMPTAVLGAGDYTRTEIIPALQGARLSLYSVANREPHIAAMVGRKYGFVLATTDSERAITEMPAGGLVVIATAHDSHTHLACVALKAGHRVFVEKPPAVTPEDVHRLAERMRTNPGAVEIGFNRRYHPLVRRARARLLRESGPISISCMVKELAFEPDHWYFWPNQGTRVSGNLCHWIDLAVFLLGGRPMPVSVTLSPRMPGTEPCNDEERALTVTFDDRSVLTIFATTRGDDIRGVQEQIDIRRGQTTITIDDLWKMRIRSGGIERYTRTLFRDKAHATMYREALRRVVAGKPSVYPVRDMIVVSAIQIAASDLVRADQCAGKLPDWLAITERDFIDP